MVWHFPEAILVFQMNCIFVVRNDWHPRPGNAQTPMTHCFLCTIRTPRTERNWWKPTEVGGLKKVSVSRWIEYWDRRLEIGDSTWYIAAWHQQWSSRNSILLLMLGMERGLAHDDVRVSPIPTAIQICNADSCEIWLLIPLTSELSMLASDFRTLNVYQWRYHVLLQ